MGILVDLHNLSASQTDGALEYIYKAIHDHGDEESIWDPLENPFIRRIVELFTQRGLDRIAAVQQQLTEWLAGAKHKKGQTLPPKPPGAMARWTPSEVDLVRIYLEALPPEAWRLDDYLMVVDYLVQRYLPADDLTTEAEWMATRSTMMGKVQANYEGLSARKADKIVAAMPSTIAEAVANYSISRAQQAMLNFGNARAAEKVVNFSEDARHRLRGLLMKYAEQQFLMPTGVARESLQTKLLDTFGTMNRDWRRIAITEAGECQLQGYVASVPEGTKLRRVEQYQSACSFCKKIHDRVVEVVSPDAPDKDPESQIWVGKDNYGRSSAPRKRVGSILVEREPDEMWWIPAGLVHPHCRGRWLPVLEDQPGDDAEFGAYLRDLLTPKAKDEEAVQS